MPSLTVWLYPTAFGAQTGELQLRGLLEREAIRVHDAATIVWMPHDPKPLVRPVKHKLLGSAGRGAIVGAVAGLVVLNPVAGAAAGAGAGAALRKIRGAGLDEEFVQGVRAKVTPGTSALLVLSSDADPAAVREFLKRTEAVLLQAELTPEAQRLLEEIGAPGPVEDAP